MNDIYISAKRHLEKKEYDQAIIQYLSVFEKDGKVFLDKNNKNYNTAALAIINVLNRICIENPFPLDKSLFTENTKKIISHFYENSEITWSEFYHLPVTLIIEKIIECSHYIFSIQGADNNLLKDKELVSKIKNQENNKINLSGKKFGEEFYSKVSNGIIFDEKVKSILCSTLFIQPLKENFIANNLAEQFLTVLRRFLLERCLYDFEFIDEDHNLLNLLRALSLNCFRNEYCWYQSAEEQEIFEKILLKVRKQLNEGKLVKSSQILILSCYKTLNEIQDLKKYLSTHTFEKEDQFIIKLQNDDIEEEKNIGRTIKKLLPIKDNVSRKVKQQYEMYPYPRWNSNFKKAYISYMDFLRKEYPHIRPIEIKDILIAGSGTGKHPITVAFFAGKVKIDAIDLSLKSLSYGKRKSKEHSIDNIDWYEGDILELDKIDKKYDIIESVGVLHHLENPKKGFDILEKKLKKNGIMKISVYAKSYRKILEPTKKFIRDNKFKNDINSIRQARRLIMESNQENLYFDNVDCYSSSSFIDLFMHEQELDFILPDLKSLFGKKFTFIGFSFPGSSSDMIRTKYKSKYIDDPKMTNLDNWADLEKEDNKVFSSMYSVYIQKNA